MLQIVLMLKYRTFNVGDNITRKLGTPHMLQIVLMLKYRTFNVGDNITRITYSVTKE